MRLRIGIDLGGTKIEGILLDGSREIARRRVVTPRHDYGGTLDAVASLVRDLDASSPASGTTTVGIGIPGAAQPDTGMIKNANSTWLIGHPLAIDLERRLGRPVRVANDANCFAVSEAADGAGAGADVVFGVIVGTGVGAGIVVRRQLLIGPNAIAGEWGHNPLPWARDDEHPGPACYCGRSGCIETFLSGPALSRDFQRATGRTATADEIVECAGTGEQAAAETLERYEDRMARALASVINVLDPDVIVLGGGLSNIERLYHHVPLRWGTYVFGATGTDDMAPVRTRLVRAAHGDSSGVRGAAWLWSEAQ
jgi:fructokinase